MAFRADDVQAARRDHCLMALAPISLNALEFRLIGVLDGIDLHLRAAAQHDVGAAAGHVGGDGDGAGPSGLGHDVRLAFVLLGIQHLVRNLLALQQLRDPLGGLDRGGADQHRLTALHAVLDILEDGLELVMLGEEHQVRLVLADHRLVRRDDHDFQAVNLLEFERFGIRRSGHAGQLRVEPEVILEGDGRDGLIFLAHLDAFLGLDRLVQAIGPAPALHGSAGEFIDDDDLALAHDVLHIALVQGVRAQGRVQVMHETDIGGVVQALAFAQQPDLRHQLLDLFMSRFGQGRLLGLLIDRVVAGAVFGFLPGQARNQGVDLDVELGALFRGSGNDQRRARLVDQNRVDFIDDGEGQLALHAILETKRQIVAQIIESKFVVGAVGDVAGVGRALLIGRLGVLDDADIHAEEAVHRPHPFRVALRQVFIHGHDVHAIAGERI